MATTSTTTTAIPKKVGKKDMKAFIRYDGRGIVVSSSVILARKMPKVGKWVEIDAYACCQPTLPITSTTTTTQRAQPEATTTTTTTEVARTTTTTTTEIPATTTTTTT